MSELSKQALKVENNQSFPNNNAGLITPTNLRTFNEDMIDSTVNQATYTTDSGSWNTQIGESVTTASLSGSDIIFEKGNGDTFSINVAGGSVPPGTISGSAQVIAALPSGTVSGSSQVSYTGLSNIPSGIVSGSSQISDITGSSLITASFDTGTRNLTFTKGNTTQFSVNIPDATGSVGNFATTGSNTFTGDQTIQSDGELNGIFFNTGSSQFFVGQRSNGNFSISGSQENRIIDINPSSNWLEVYAPQTNFNNNVAFRATTDVRNINTTTGLGFVAQFDNFTASLQEGYAWVGKNGGTSISVPTSSFAGVAPVGVATTGSNIFIGDQTITGSVNVSGGEHLFIKRSNTGANQLLRLGATDNENNFAFIVTGSDTNPGQQVWGINTAGGIWANSFDAGVVFNSYVTASQGINITNGTFSAPLQQGYVWAGDANGRTMTVPTSSFGGTTDITSLNAFTASQQILNATYATTASNTFSGNQTINANLVANKVSAYNFDSLFLGSQMGGTTANGTFFGYGSTDYSFIVGAYAGGFDSELKILADNTGITLSDFNGSSYPSFLKLNTNTGANPAPILTRGVEITGSVKLTPASVSTSAQYPITFISGSTISKDSVDTLVYNPSTNQLLVSASTGTANISANAITFTSGSGAYGTYASTVSKVQIQSSIEGGGVIGISGNPSKIGAPSLTNFTKPGILALSSSAQPYVAIELQNSASFTDGRVTMKRKLVAEQGTEFTGSFTATIPTASSESQTNLFNFAPFVGANGTTYTSANISLQDYASSAIDQTFTVEYANADFQKYTGLVVGPTTAGSLAKFTINTGVGYDFDEISLVDNGNNTSTALIKADTIELTGTINANGPLLFTTGSNKQAGTATLDGGNPGTVTVSNSLVTADSIIFLTKQSLGNTHSVAITAKSAGSFTITSTGNGDSDVVGWFIINNS